MKKIAFAILMMLPMLASAAQVTTKQTVGKTFTSGTVTAGFYTKQGLTQCLGQAMYVNLSTDAGRAQFSMIIAAKAAKQNIILIDYTADASNICRLNALFIE